jgi:hypothetical protein
MAAPLALTVLALLAGVVPAAGGAADEPKKPRLADQFLIFGTVFEESGRLLPGAEIQVRRAGEKKVRWRHYSDRRGEFGVRVPPGAEYDLTAKAKGFEEQTRRIDARNGTREDIVIRMRPAAKGEKK